MIEKLIPLLLDCLHQDHSRLDRATLGALSEPEWQDLLALAAEQRVRALFYHNLKERGLEELVPAMSLQALKDFHTQNTIRNLRYSGELKRIVTVLTDKNIPVLVLKGIYLAHVIYENISLREMNDMDLLLHKEHLAQATELVVGMGYQPLTPFSMDWEPTYNHLPKFIKPDVAGVELHWSIITPGRSPKFDIQDFWDHALPMEIANAEMLCLPPEDILLYLCFHNAKHTFAFGLRPYCDIQAAIYHFSPALDWIVVLVQARRWGWERGVYLSLQLAREFVGAEVPESVLETLRPEGDTETIYALARLQTFADKKRVQEMNPDVISYAKLSARKKIGLLGRRFFLSRLEMANKYNVAPDLLAIWLKYPVRWRDLLIKYWSALQDIQESDDELTKLTDQTGIIYDWLFTDNPFKNKL